ncbi:uncharacterized protein LOC144118708 [Amblyomma americanum]
MHDMPLSDKRELHMLSLAWLLLALSGLAAGGRCPKLPTAGTEDWNAISGKYWLEIATYPPVRPCVVRIYYPERSNMMWYRLQGYGGAVTMKRQYDFITDNNQQYLHRNGRFFQQILDTDNQSWALLHVCADNDGKSKILFTTREPWTMMPVEVQYRVTMALQNAGLPMLPLTLTACVPHQQPAVPLMRSQVYGK